MKKVLINVEDRELRVAILEDDQLVEYYSESLDERSILNNIYRGRIEGILPGLNAAFVNIGLEKNAFLHFDDVRPDVLMAKAGISAKPAPAALEAEPTQEAAEVAAEVREQVETVAEVEAYEATEEELEIARALNAEIAEGHKREHEARLAAAAAAHQRAQEAALADDDDGAEDDAEDESAPEAEAAAPGEPWAAGDDADAAGGRGRRRRRRRRGRRGGREEGEGTFLEAGQAESDADDRAEDDDEAAEDAPEFSDGSEYNRRPARGERDRGFDRQRTASQEPQEPEPKLFFDPRLARRHDRRGGKPEDWANQRGFEPPPGYSLDWVIPDIGVDLETRAAINPYDGVLTPGAATSKRWRLIALKRGRNMPDTQEAILGMPPRPYDATLQPDSQEALFGAVRPRYDENGEIIPAADFPAPAARHGHGGGFKRPYNKFAGGKKKRKRKNRSMKRNDRSFFAARAKKETADEKPTRSRKAAADEAPAKKTTTKAKAAPAAAKKATPAAKATPVKATKKAAAPEPKAAAKTPAKKATATATKAKAAPVAEKKSTAAKAAPVKAASKAPAKKAAPAPEPEKKSASKAKAAPAKKSKQVIEDFLEPIMSAETAKPKPRKSAAKTPEVAPPPAPVVVEEKPARGRKAAPAARKEAAVESAPPPLPVILSEPAPAPSPASESRSEEGGQGGRSSRRSGRGRRGDRRRDDREPSEAKSSSAAPAQDAAPAAQPAAKQESDGEDDGGANEPGISEAERNRRRRKRGRRGGRKGRERENELESPAASADGGPEASATETSATPAQPAAAPASEQEPTRLRWKRDREHPRDRRDRGRDNRDREPREQREPREPREPREAREPREQREVREPREPREPRDPRGNRRDRDRERFQRDRGPRPPRVKLPSFTEVFKKGDEIMVQVIKEEIGTKGARISTFISIPGRYLVLLPYPNEEGGVSRKVEDVQERQRLKRLLREISGEDYGFIIRTAGIERDEADIRKDVEFLTGEWKAMSDRYNSTKGIGPIADDQNILYKLCRDVFDDNVGEIVIDSHQEADNLKEILQRMIPSLVDRVKVHDEPENIFVRHGVDKMLTKAARRKVWLKSGGYLIIDEAEALTAIDVNTGKFVGKDDQEKMILKTNLEAARTISRELKLRDIGGLIVIDFIDMKDQRNRDSVLAELKGCLRKDRSKTSVSPISEFGLVEMTRKRVRRSLRKTLFSDCPYCQGAGVILSDQQIWLHIKHELVRVLEASAGQTQEVNITVNPRVRQYIDQNYREIIGRLESKYSCKIHFQGTELVHMENFRFERVTRAEV